MATPQARYSGPKFGIREIEGKYSGPVYQVTPGGVPVKEYPKFVDAGSEPPAPVAPSINLPVYNSPATIAPPENPVATPPYNAAEAADGEYGRLLTAPVVDTNGRGKSALIGALAPIQPNNSLGNMIGQRLAGFANGLIDPTRDEEGARQAAIREAERIRKIQNEDSQAQADLEYRRAAAANQQNLPVWRDAEQQRKEAEANRRLDALERRQDIQGSYNSERLGQGDRKIDETVRSDKERESDRDADRQTKVSEGEKNRANRVEVARVLANSREQIAAQQQSIERDRLEMNKDQFKLKYPGAGNVLTQDAIVEKYNRLKKADPMLTIDKVTAEAVRQGYTIQ